MLIATSTFVYFFFPPFSLMTPAGINELIKRSSMHILMSYLFLLTSLVFLKLMILMYQTLERERLARKFSDARPSFQDKINGVVKKT